MQTGHSLHLVVGPRMNNLSGAPLLDHWTTWMQAAGQSVNTIQLRRSHISHALEALRTTDPWSITTDQLAAFIASKNKPNTKRSYRASLRAFYGWGRDHGLIALSPAHALPPVKVPRSLPRPIAELDYRVAVSSSTTRMIRVAVQLGGRCGLRRSEIARTRREDLIVRGDGYWLEVEGKGGHQRLVPVAGDLAAEILASRPGWLFPSPRRPGDHLTPAIIGKYITAQLPGAWTTHSLRHRCGTMSLLATKDLRAVQELLGHAKPETTAIYTLIGDDRIRAAMEAAA